MKAISIALLSFAVAGCATNPYQQFYQSNGDITQLKDVEFLPEGHEPELYQVDFKEVDATIKALHTRGYVSIGYSSFNGGYEDVSSAKSQAKRLKAVIVIVGANYTDTQTSTVPLYLPTTQNTYDSGTVSAGGTYGTYSGSSTTYGSTVVPITRQERRYDQGARYFVKGTRKYRFGFEYSDLGPDQRQAFGRNTGAVVQIVIEKTPVFYANVLEGDVIIAVDGIEIRGQDEADKVMGQVSPDAKSSILTILRAGVERKIEVKF